MSPRVKNTIGDIFYGNENKNDNGIKLYFQMKII